MTVTALLSPKGPTAYSRLGNARIEPLLPGRRQEARHAFQVQGEMDRRIPWIGMAGEHLGRAADVHPDVPDLAV